MARINSENPSPLVGVVIPTKEISANVHDRESQFGITNYIRSLPDHKNFFAVVYHHTLIGLEEIIAAKASKGETRYRGDNVSFPDPISLLNLLAELTDKMQLYTAVMVAPQMQTAFLAQQVAAIANASDGRFNLGVGVGWNQKEYDALGVGYRFKGRGRILNQQIPAIEMLLTGKSVNLNIKTEFGENARKDTSERIDHMLLNPAAMQPVPIWVGGFKKPAIRRAAKYGTGWMPLGDLDFFMENQKFLLECLEKNERDPEKFKTMGRIALGKIPPSEWVDQFLGWKKAGVTHLALTTTVDEEDHDRKNSDPFHHQHLLYEFSEATSWITNPQQSLSYLFGKHGSRRVTGQIVDTIMEKEKKEDSFLLRFKLKTKIKIEHLITYLEERGFQKFEAKGTFTNQGLSKKPLTLHTIMKKGTDQKIGILRENCDDGGTVVVFTNGIETRMG